MTEITRVPLQPIAKGSLTKLWLGVVAAVLVGGSVAYAAMPPSVDVETITAGSGESPTLEDISLVNYKGMLANGKVFDEGKGFVAVPGRVIPGWTKALTEMQRGGKYKVHIPAALAYGADGGGPIPPNSDLDFEMELVDFKTPAEIAQRQRMIEQLQQLQQLQQQGAPGAAAPAPEGVPPAQ